MCEYTYQIILLLNFVFLTICLSIYLFIIYHLSIFRQRGREGEIEGEKYQWLPLACPLVGTWSATQACALTGNGTSDPLVHRPALSSLSHTSHSCLLNFKYLKCYVFTGCFHFNKYTCLGIYI